MDGEDLPRLHNCEIWEREKDYTNCKELIFHIPCNITCEKLCGNNNLSIVHVLKLKLNDNTVIGFLEFIEDDHFKLSNSDLEILESLSQILAYIINNKEQVNDITAYIKQKFMHLEEST